MTAITMPQQDGDEKKQIESGDKIVEESPAIQKLCGCVWILSLMLFLSVVIGFTMFGTWWYAVVASTPSCDKAEVSAAAVRQTDVNFKKHGKYDGNDFDEDLHYDHVRNALVANLVNTEGAGENATVIHDLNKGISTRVIRSHQRCFVGKLDQEDVNGLAGYQNGDIQEIQDVHSRRYQTTGPIAPEYLERTLTPLATDHCKGFQTSWIEPIDSLPEKRSAYFIIITSSGDVIIVR